jgi:hypothetical protein
MININYTKHLLQAGIIVGAEYTVEIKKRHCSET